jgi:hypothetical protein
MGKRELLNIGGKERLSAYKEQYQAASQQYIANYFSLLGKPTRQCCVGDLNEKEKCFNLPPPPL